MNLAAQAGVRYSIENPDAYTRSNLVGFANLLECCRHHKVGHFVFASSSSVYGKNKKVPFSEDDRVDFPVSYYAATKKANELMPRATRTSISFRSPVSASSPCTAPGDAPIWLPALHGRDPRRTPDQGLQ